MLQMLHPLSLLDNLHFWFVCVWHASMLCVVHGIVCQFCLGCVAHAQKHMVQCASYHYPAFSSLLLSPPTKTTHLFQTSIDRPDRHDTAYLLIIAIITYKIHTFSFTHHLSKTPQLPGHHRRHPKVIQELLIETIPKKAFSFSLLHLFPLLFNLGQTVPIIHNEAPQPLQQVLAHSRFPLCRRSFRHSSSRHVCFSCWVEYPIAFKRLVAANATGLGDRRLVFKRPYSTIRQETIAFTRRNDATGNKRQNLFGHKEIQGVDRGYKW